MTEISFGSTYRIPITQAGVNGAKKAKLRELIESYPNGLIGKSKTGQARISVPDSEDENFLRKLKAIGYKVFQKFEGDNISKENLDTFIKNKLETKDFAQKGKNPTRLSKETKEQRRYERRYIAPAKKEPEAEILPEPNKTVEQQPTKAIEQTQEIKPKKEPIIWPKAEVKPQINKKAKIRESENYIRIKNQYGEEFAEAVFFGIKK